MCWAVLLGSCTQICNRSVRPARRLSVVINHQCCLSSVLEVKLFFSPCRGHPAAPPTGVTLSKDGVTPVLCHAPGDRLHRTLREVDDNPWLGRTAACAAVTTSEYICPFNSHRKSYPRPSILPYTLFIPSNQGPLTGGDHQRGRGAGRASAHASRR